MDKDGNAVGITAEKYYGTSLTINAKVETGSVVKADSIEALAKAAGMSPEILSSNIELYNKHCAAKKDETFGKDPYFSFFNGPPVPFKFYYIDILNI